MSLVARRIDVFVLEGMGDVAGHIDAGDFASPEEIPVLFDLERFVPADRSQNVAVGDEAIANVMAPTNRSPLLQESAMNTEPATIALQQSRALFIVAQGREQIDVVVLIELGDQFRQFCPLGHQMVVVGEDDDGVSPASSNRLRPADNPMS